MATTDVLQLALAVALVGAALVLLLPINECDRCAHCRQERWQKKEREKAAEHDHYHRVYGEDRCPRCKKEDR